jgi:hypothetical protein
VRGIQPAIWDQGVVALQIFSDIKMKRIPAYTLASALSHVP